MLGIAGEFVEVGHKLIPPLTIRKPKSLNTVKLPSHSIHIYKTNFTNTQQWVDVLGNLKDVTGILNRICINIGEETYKGTQAISTEIM